MAHVLTIIPRGIRTLKKTQTLSCLKQDAKQRLNCPAQIQHLKTDTFEHKNK